MWKDKYLNVKEGLKLMTDDSQWAVPPNIGPRGLHAGPTFFLKEPGTAHGSRHEPARVVPVPCRGLCPKKPTNRFFFSFKPTCPTCLNKPTCLTCFCQDHVPNMLF